MSLRTSAGLLSPVDAAHGSVKQLEALSGSPSTRASLHEQELCAFLERLLEQHHDRLLRDVESLLSAPRWQSVDAVEELVHMEHSHNSACASRQSYDMEQVGKRRSAKEAAQPCSPRMEMKVQGSQSQGRRSCAKLVNSPTFELLSCGLIVANAIFFGVEAQLNATMAEDDMREFIFWFVGLLFTGMVTVEIMIRMASEKAFCFAKKNSFWNIFDLSILAAGMVEMTLPLVGMESKTSLTHVRIVRVARAVKALRIVRLLNVFDSLRILVNSVINTLRSLVWTLVLLAVILYLFGLLFTNAALEELKLKTGEDRRLLELHFGSLFASVYTLFQAITNGISWAPVAEVLRDMHPAWEGLFTVFIMFIYFAVLNVVTGVFCQSAIESANQDKDTLVQAQLSIQRVYTEQLQLIFSQIDEDNTGFITLSMLEEALHDDQVKAYFDGLDLTTDDAWHLFQLMDKNASNSIDLREFVEGCLRLRGRARSIDIHMLMHQSEWTMKRLSDVLEDLASLQLRVGPGVMGSPRNCSLRSSRASMQRGSERLMTL